MLFTFTRLPSHQWCNVNAIERITKSSSALQTQTALPTHRPPLCCSGLFDSDPSDGWQTSATELIHQPIDLVV
jgi:hypothetical protein